MLTLIFIFSAELLKALTVLSVAEWAPFLPVGLSASTVLVVFFAIQLFAISIQGDLSDHYCRKKSIIVANAALTLASSLLVFVPVLGGYALVLAIWLRAGFGNGDVIARAALFEIGYSGSHKLLMGLSFGVLALPWILLINVKQAYGLLSVPVELFTLFVCASSLLLSCVWFSDRRDKRERGSTRSRDEPHTYIKFITNRILVISSVALLLNEVAFQVVYLFQESSDSGYSSLVYTNIFGVAFLTGAVIQIFISINHYWTYVWGVTLPLVGLLVLAIAISLGEKALHAPFLVGYGLLSLGSGVYLPRFFLLFTDGYGDRYKDHDRGKLFGCFESAIVLGEVLASGALNGGLLTPLSFCWVATGLLFVGLVTFCFANLKQKYASI